MTNKNQKEIETWTPEQLAIMLHVSTQRIYETIENGLLPAQKIGMENKQNQKKMLTKQERLQKPEIELQKVLQEAFVKTEDMLNNM